ncbi:unnamed protein product [Camellia sinensis]
MPFGDTTTTFYLILFQNTRQCLTLLHSLSLSLSKMNKVFAAFWYSGILPLLSCTTTIPTTTTTITTTFENHESLSRPQSAKKAKKARTKAKQQQNQSFEKELQEMQEKLQQLRIEKEQTEELLKAREDTLKMKEEELEARRKEREKLQTELKKLQKMKEFKPTMDQQPMSPFLAFTAESMRLLEEEQHLQLKKKKKDPSKPKTSMEEKTSIEARLRAERATVERATTEARQRAFQKVMAEKSAFEARERVERSVADKSSACYKNGGMRQSSSFSDVESQGVGSSIGLIYSYSSVHGGVGIMCMMSAGKAEISRLNTAVDETTKVVQELKIEFSRRKSSRNLQVSSSKTEISTSPYKTRGKHTEPIPQSSTENRDNVQDSGVFVTEEGESTSSVLTEEPQQEVLEMDLLEAELESELQKLSWCSTEASGFEGKISDICEVMKMLLSKDFTNQMCQTSDSCQLSGVLPSELDQKLCHLLIEQQESQIVGLESELHWAQSKLHEKETELQALKDYVKHLTEFSLATASDEESEAQKEEEKIIDHGDYDNKMGPESKRSVVGMKRSMDFEPYSCDMK